MGFHYTKAHAGILFDFLLQALCKLLVALHRNDGQCIHIETADALTLLVDTQTQATADGLSPLAFSCHVAQSTDLEYVRVIPAFF